MTTKGTIKQSRISDWTGEEITQDMLRSINPEKYDKLQEHIEKHGLQNKVRIVISDDMLWNWDDGLDLESM